MNRAIASFYERIHGRYDLVNRWITFGLDEVWRRKLAQACGAMLPERSLVIDLCTGTGRTALALRRMKAGEVRIVGVDFSLEMLRQAQKRFPCVGTLEAVAADARHIPFPEESADLVITSFATRNLDARPGDYEQVMGELRRILKPGGFWFQLETSQPASPWIRRLFHLFVGLWVPLVSRIIGEDRDSYRYLTRSIIGFDSPGGLSRRLTDNGFRLVETRGFFLGAATLLVVEKSRKTEAIPVSAT